MHFLDIIRVSRQSIDIEHFLLKLIFFLIGITFTINLNIVLHSYKQIVLFLLETSNQILQLIVLLIHFFQLTLLMHLQHLDFLFKMGFSLLIGNIIVL